MNRCCSELGSRQIGFGFDRKDAEMKSRLESMSSAILFLGCLALAASAGQQHAGSAQAKKKADELIAAIKAGRVIDLNFIWDSKSPVLSLNPPFAIGLHSSHRETKGLIPGGIAFAEDMMFFSGQHGAPTIDALGHISDNGKHFNGIDAEANESPAGLKTLGIETYPKEKYINRAVLLDVARFKKVEALAPGQEITAEDLEATAKSEGVEIKQGDSVLIRTGFGKYFESDRAKYSGPRPGPGESAAKWLASKKIFLTGDDQMSFEVVPEKGSIFPCHRILIGDSGIYLVENLNLEDLSKALAESGVYEFTLVMNPPRIRGATGMALNAFAILP
jgi:kynurenine formamidase